MRLFLHYPAGRRMEAVLLATSPDRLRIIVRGQSQTVELRRRHGHWYSEKGKRVEFDAILALDSAPAIMPAAPAVAAVAGSFAYH